MRLLGELNYERPYDTMVNGCSGLSSLQSTVVNANNIHSVTDLLNKHGRIHKMRLVCVLFTFENNAGPTDGPTDGHDLL